MLSKRKKLISALIYAASVVIYIYLVTPFIRGGVLSVLGTTAFKGDAKSVSLLSDWYLGFIWLLSLTLSAIFGVGLGYFINKYLEELKNG